MNSFYLNDMNLDETMNKLNKLIENKPDLIQKLNRMIISKPS